MLSEIWIYPIKSLAGIRLKQARVLPKGLENDRRWMLIDENGRFITQREHPEMALFKVDLNDNQIAVTDNSGSTLSIELNTSKTARKLVAQIWDDEVEVVEVDTGYSEWFSATMKMKCALVYFPEHNVRDVDPDYAVKKEQVSLADGYPFLIIGQESLNDLNTRLASPITMRRFRPNFVFTGGKAFAEDQWQNFSIGNNRFAGVKLCARCVLTTVDPETGNKGAEPLATLATFRKRNNKINFGQNVLPLDYGEVKEGDRIIVE